ncbi:MAG: CheR family methyltransferase, partial [Myxococcota bacterium]
GCSTGEEAYTMAIILTEKLAGTSCSIHITATDLSPRALAAARHGRYPASALDHVPEPWRRIGFEAEGGSSFYRVAARAARRVTFEQHNLLDSPYPGPFDLICCRNVLIYFTAAARRRVIDKLIASLGPGGMLLVGYSESLRDVDELEAERVAGTVIYRRQTSQPAPRTRRVTLPMSAKPGRDSRRSGPVQPTRAQRTTAPLGLVPTRTRRITAPLPGLVPRADTRPSGSRPDDGQPPRPRPGDGPSERSELLIRLAGRYDDAARLSAELAPALAGTYQRAHIDLDGAEYLGDDAAAIVTRAVSAARATGIELVVHASRPGPRRWLRRHRLDRGSHRTAPGQTAPGQDPSDSDGGEP